MSARRLTLMTPEEVPLVFTVAPTGLRILSFGLDLFLVLVTVLLLGVLLVEVAFDSDSPGPNRELWTALVNLLVFLIWNFYFVITELRWQGRTLGKRLTGLRVIARDGGPLSADLVFARNLTRDLELLIPVVALLNPELIGLTAPWQLALGWLWLGALMFLPLFNRYRARLGDLVAGTLVVLAPRETLLPDLVEQAPAAEAADARYRFEPEQLETYGIRELQILEDLLRRRQDIIDPELLQSIADRIRAKIGWEAPPGVTVEPYAFLQAFYTAQRARLEQQLLFGQRREVKVR